MKKKIFSRIAAVIREEEQEIAGGKNSVKKRLFFKSFLSVLSLGYKAGLLLRRGLYKTGILFPEKAPLKVVSVGNLAVGGRFKTPFALFLWEKYVQAGKKPAVSTRGYLSATEKSGKSIALGPDCLKEPGSGISFQNFGDEVFLFLTRAARFSKPENARVVIGKNRLKSAFLAKKLKMDVLILDDGFQQKKILQDVKILLLKRSDLSEQRHFLPRGALRDFPQRAASADFIAVEEKDLSFALNRFEEKKVLAFQSFFSCFQELAMHPKELSCCSLKNSKAAVFCAIGDPVRFVSDLKQSGLQIVKESFLLDHEPASLEFLKTFAAEAKAAGSEFLVCTEKDAVKFLFAGSESMQNKDFQDLGLPVYYPKLELKLVFGQANLEKALRINLLSAMMDKAKKSKHKDLSHGKRDSFAQAGREHSVGDSS